MNTGFVYGNVSNGDTIQYPCSVYLMETGKIIETDQKGNFKIAHLPFSNYRLIVTCVGYQTDTIPFILDTQEKELKVKMVPRHESLGTVVVKSNAPGVGSLRRMRSLEGYTLIEGKKNEVVSLAGIQSNKSVNVGRQIYARIPGLNIWESDAAGIQLGIGGRGLSPNRTSNFNTRQNGYEISADALGYPESYYTPPSEALKEIQFIRGAASLQFGTQFGGLLNFVLKDGPEENGSETSLRQTIGSFGLLSTFVDHGILTDKFKGYGYLQYKTGNEWRPNSGFDLISGGLNLKSNLTEKTELGIEYTKQYYLAQQPGGLTDKEFYEDPSISKRSRNWFKVDWNLMAVSLSHQFAPRFKIKTQFFGLLASRNALGVLGNISRPDNLADPLDLIQAEFKNWGNETRLVRQFEMGQNIWTLAGGFRYYQGHNHSKQGIAISDDDPIFEYETQPLSDYKFPSKNFSLFAEQMFQLNKKFSITPGARFEYIQTTANGKYRVLSEDLAGNIISDISYNDDRNNGRSFVIAGIGASYRITKRLELYTNATQNYRSINFTDMQIVNNNFRIDPNLKDETGFNLDFGLRGVKNELFIFDISGYLLSYNDKIGEIDQVDETTFIPYRYRTNISKALVKGIEAVAEISVLKLMKADMPGHSITLFTNIGLNDAKYIGSEQSAYENKKVESVPAISFKGGMNYTYKSLKISYQYTYTGEQFSDATNAGKDINGDVIFISNALVGLIPAYSVMDLNVSLGYKKFQIESGINNFLDELYFTRRATGYPGPGIIPSTRRSFYFTLQYKF